MRDIDAGIVYLVVADDGVPAGTVTLTDNEIDRLFVLPEFQGKGYGRALLDFAEERIAAAYDVIILHASLSAKNIYLKRGFREVDYIKIDTGYGDFLCADVMEKKAK
jgi:GNAT superfamily N-acetyltransferase